MSLLIVNSVIDGMDVMTTSELLNNSRKSGTVSAHYPIFQCKLNIKADLHCNWFKSRRIAFQRTTRRVLDDRSKVELNSTPKRTQATNCLVGDQNDCNGGELLQDCH